jgi:aminoglycoside phosphotransferase (APT) family kinase protein
VLRRLGGGLGSATHLVELGDGRRLVLKRYRDAEDVTAEWERLCFAHGAELPVPRPLAVDDAGAWFGTPAFAIDVVPGRPLLSPPDIDMYLDEVAGATARMHAAPVTNGTGRLLQPHPVDRWEAPASVPAGLLSRQMAARVIGALRDRLPAATRGEPVLNHCDFHPGNLVWQRRRLSGIVDWSAARVGFRWWDLAYFRVELALIVDVDAADELLARYERIVGASSPDQAVWDLLCLYNGHRWAHTWLTGYREQGRRDLDLETFQRRLRSLTRRTLQAVPG